MDGVADGIAIGGIRVTADRAALNPLGIGAVLQLYGPEAQPPRFPADIAALQLFVLDGTPIPADVLRQGVQFIREQRDAGRNILVACGSGRSRSVSFVAAYLHEQGMDLPEALRAIVRSRRDALPHPELLRSLVEHYGLEVSASELLVAVV